MNGGTGGGLHVTGALPRKHTFPERRLLLGLATLLLILFLLSPLLRVWRRRRRLRQASAAPRRLILTTYDVFTERAAELGMPRAPGETLEEYRARVRAAGFGTDDLDRLTQEATRAAYGPAEPGPGEVQAATEAASGALGRLRRATPLARRVRGRYTSVR